MKRILPNAVDALYKSPVLLLLLLLSLKALSAIGTLISSSAYFYFRDELWGSKEDLQTTARFIKNIQHLQIWHDQNQHLNAEAEIQKITVTKCERKRKKKSESL